MLKQIHERHVRRVLRPGQDWPQGAMILLFAEPLNVITQTFWRQWRELAPRHVQERIHWFSIHELVPSFTGAEQQCGSADRKQDISALGMAAAVSCRSPLQMALAELTMRYPTLHAIHCLQGHEIPVVSPHELFVIQDSRIHTLPFAKVPNDEKTLLHVRTNLQDPWYATVPNEEKPELQWSIQHLYQEHEPWMTLSGRDAGTVAKDGTPWIQRLAAVMAAQPVDVQLQRSHWEPLTILKHYCKETYKEYRKRITKGMDVPKPPESSACVPEDRAIVAPTIAGRMDAWTHASPELLQASLQSRDQGYLFLSNVQWSDDAQMQFWFEIYDYS